ncbi:MAG: hypothetical protein K0Q76_2918 [Panacagrimonas sp.]|nr:hypothetical protein [Panacagrimonas sp.]MCC2657810.1 hypothetical protein [Panacagrimonas sp.]
MRRTRTGIAADDRLSRIATPLARSESQSQHMSPRHPKSTPPPLHRGSYELRYEAAPASALAPDVLACVRFGTPIASAADPREIGIALPQIGGVALAEVWRSRLPVTYGVSDGIGWAQDGEVVFGHLRLEADQISNWRQSTTDAYVRMERLLRRLGYPHPLRLWNFVSDINVERDGAERYQQFSLGRRNALKERPGFENALPAATAIGTRDGGLSLCFLAARVPGEPVENPRQVSAFRYPREYGPASPSFARATQVRSAVSVHLFVSGTASVVGHRTQHPGEARAQLEETLRNVAALLRHAAGRTPLATSYRPIGLKVYFRSEHEAPALIARLQSHFGADVPLLCVVGDICRRDLLLEIEGVFVAAPRVPALQVAA